MDDQENTTGSDQTTETSPANETEQTGSTDTSTTQTTETSTEEGGTLLTPKDGQETEQPPEDPAAEFHGAPEGDYEMIELPEGMTVDQDALGAFTPVAKELGLSQAGFAKVVETYAQTILPQVQDRVVDNLQKDISAQHAAWANESMEMLRTDDTFKGMKLEDVQQVAAKALDRFGGTEIREFLQTTGLGNHPAFLKAFYHIGTAISEDTTFERGGTAPAAKSRTEKYYGPQT